MTAITGTGVLVSRRHQVCGAGLVIATARLMAKHDILVYPFNEAALQNLVIAAPGGRFGLGQAPTLLPGQTETPVALPPPVTSTLAVSIGASVPPTVGALAVNFTSSPSGGTPSYSYLWAFGDGGSATSQNPSHTYATPGSYLVTLQVTDATGFVRSSNLTVYAGITFSTIVTAAPVDGSSPLSVQFTATPTNGTPSYSYAWDFGDSTTSTAQNPAHTYAAPGTWPGRVTVTDASGHVIVAAISVPVVTALTAAPLAIPDNGYVGLVSSFYARVSGGNAPYAYQWDFDDSTPVSTVENPVHAYPLKGFYNVHLQVTDSRGRVFSTYVAVRVIPKDPVPLPPSNVFAVASIGGIRDRQITVHWDASAYAIVYKVYRGTAPGGEDPVPVAVVAGTSYLDTGLDHGQVYYYYLKASNDTGDSQPSAEASAETEPNVRPNNATLASAGAVYNYFPLDRVVARLAGGGDALASTEGTGMYGGWDTRPTTVPGYFDWAMTGARIELDSDGGGGGIGYPTGAWTWSYSIRIRQLALSQNFDVVWKLLGGATQFYLRCTAGNLGAGGFSSLTPGGYPNDFMFPENDGDSGYGVKLCGTFPNDLLDHIVQLTVTNDTTGASGGTLKVWVDGVLQGTFVGRVGNYFGSDNYRNYVGGYNGVAGSPRPQIAISDVGEWKADVSSIFHLL